MAPNDGHDGDPGQVAEGAPQASIGNGASTLTGGHVPILVREVLECLQPQPGDVAVDCTIGGGGHARELLARLRPGGRLIGLDADPLELPRTEQRLRAEGFGANELSVRCANFSGLPGELRALGTPTADLILVDLGISTMQSDNPVRGFSYKGVGPLDMRMNPFAGETAAQLVSRTSETDLASILVHHADEPHAALIARILKSHVCVTTHGVQQFIRDGLLAQVPDISRADVKMSIRRTFQALRIAVNGELGALDALLGALPSCLSPGGRVAVITFHSGEDRRVKKAFQHGRRSGVFSDVARNAIRSQKAETFSNRRASAAKLRWARRATQ